MMITNSMTIEEIEEKLFPSLDTTENMWIDLSKGMIEVRNSALFEDKINPASGKPFRNWEEYLRDISKTMRKKYSSGSVSTIKAWITKFEVYAEQLGYPEDWLITMGSHANIMLKAANLSPRGRMIQVSDQALIGGGLRLGKTSFHTFSDDI